MPMSSPEYSVVRSYIENICEFPWNVKLSTDVSMNTARTILENDHFGLEEVKIKIYRFLAVSQLAKIRANAVTAGASTGGSTAASSVQPILDVSDPSSSLDVSDPSSSLERESERRYPLGTKQSPAHAPVKILCLVGPPGVGVCVYVFVHVYVFAES